MSHLYRSLFIHPHHLTEYRGVPVFFWYFDNKGDEPLISVPLRGTKNLVLSYNDFLDTSRLSKGPLSIILNDIIPTVIVFI